MGSLQQKNEQAAIHAFHRAFTTGASFSSVAPMVDTIMRAFPASPVLQYYAGKAFERDGNTDRARTQFEKCLALNPDFTPPAFDLARLHLGFEKFKEAERVLLRIFNRETLDGTVYRRSFEDDVRICQILGPEYARRKQPGKAVWLYGQAWTAWKTQKVDMALAKNLALALGSACMRTDPPKAHAVYSEGLGVPRSRLTHDLDKSLLQGTALAAQYVGARPPPPPLVDEVYAAYRKFGGSLKTKTKTKIHIGYLSPDFNKNAVGLFVTPLLKHFSTKKFEVTVFYTNAKADEFTAMFRRYPGVRWIDAGGLGHVDLARCIRALHIDILVDLLGHGHGGRLEVIAMRPAPIIINYLGFPDRVGLREYTHRLTDGVADAVADPENTTEKLAFLPRCFLCYHLFDIVPLPRIRGIMDPGNTTQVFLGVMNRLEKQSRATREAWRQILRANPSAVLCVKLDADGDPAQDFSDFAEFAESSPAQLQVLPFSHTLDGYLDQFNALDFCLDTFPYSGTTTTCSALLMGVPVFTVYDPVNKHVSNVSASILRACASTDLVNLVDLDDCICPSVEEYVRRVSAAISAALRGKKMIAREAVRASFLRAMDPVRFMAEYETLLGSFCSL